MIEQHEALSATRPLSRLSILRLLRPKQWVKNLLVFAALLFTRSYLDMEKVGLAGAAFLAMCLVSSAIYVLNDLMDVERDRRHPVKRNRPLASGAVPRGLAMALVPILLIGGLATGAWIGRSALALLLGYVALQGLYNLGLKRQPVADVFTISLGFVLRAALGAAAIAVGVSGWLLFCTGALALLLGFGKRRHEFILQGEDRESSRESLGHYSRQALDALILTSAGGAAMSYGVYSIESPTAERNPGLILTSLFVFYGIYRYVYLLLARDEGGEPETLLLRDPHMILTVILYTLSVLMAMSGFAVPFVEGGRT